MASYVDHPLSSKWVFWYQQRTGRGGPPMASRWSDSLKQLQEFDTVGKFWDSYCHIERADKLGVGTDIHLFKKGVQPTWEDAANKGGGKWSLKVKKGATAFLWERLVLACIGAGFGDDTPAVVGAVLSVRYNNDTLSLWTTTADDAGVLDRIRAVLVSALGLPGHVASTLQFKPHKGGSAAPAFPDREEGGRHISGGRYHNSTFSRGGGGGGREYSGGREASGGSREYSGGGGRTSNPAFGRWKGRGGQNDAREGGGGYEKAPRGPSVADMGNWRRGPDSPAPAPAPAQAPAPAKAPATSGGRSGDAAPAPADAPAPQSRHLLALRRVPSSDADGGEGPDEGGVTPGGRRRRPRGGPAQLGS